MMKHLLLFFACWMYMQQLAAQTTAPASAPDFNSGVQLGTLTPERIRDLALLGKVWGFLKYHHPAVASGKMDWDKSLFEFLNRYQPRNTRQRDEMLVGWIESLGELPECKKCQDKIKDEVVLECDRQWRENKDISQALRRKLQEVYDHRQLKKNHYIDMSQGVGNPAFTNEEAYKDVKFPDEGLRLLSLFRYWNMIHYFFPYRDVIGENWNDILDRYIPKMVMVGSALEYKLLLRQVIGEIHDTHANLWIQDNELREYFGRLRPPVQVRFVENKLLVTDYYHAELGPASSLRVGDVITHIRNIPVDTLVARKLHLYPASNRATQLRDMARDLLRSNEAEIPLVVLRDQEKISLNVACFDGQEKKYIVLRDYAYRMPDSCYQWIQPDIGYLYLGNIKSGLVSEIMRKFKDTKGLIVDIRNYPSEFVVFTLGNLLKAEESDFVYFTAGSVAHPGTFTRTQALSVGGSGKDAYQGKVVILVNEMTQSQAEYTAMALRSAPGSVVIGSTTAGADGNVSDLILPGGMRSMISGIGVFYPDGKPTQRVGIVPDIWAEPTVAGIRAGRDEVLEKAVEWINKH